MKGPVQKLFGTCGETRVRKKCGIVGHSVSGIVSMNAGSTPMPSDAKAEEAAAAAEDGEEDDKPPPTAAEEEVWKLTPPTAVLGGNASESIKF